MNVVLFLIWFQFLSCVGINVGKHSVSKPKQLYLSTTEAVQITQRFPKYVFSFAVLLSCYWQNDTFKETLAMVGTYCARVA